MVETPILVAIGNRIGVKMTMAARASISIPAIKSRILSSSRMTMGLSVSPSMVSASIAGAF